MRHCCPSDLAGRPLHHLSTTPIGGAGRIRTHTAYPYALAVFKTALLTNLSTAPLTKFYHAVLSSAIMWSWWSDSNTQPTTYKEAALPLSYTSMLNPSREERGWMGYILIPTMALELKG